MHLVADLHIHSHYSRATSRDLTFEHLTKWAQLKGVHIVGTGDIAHPGWLQEMRESLVPAEEGLYRLQDDIAAAVAAQVPPSCRGPVRFLLAGEISNIYKRDGATRKIHHVVFAPHLDAVERLQSRLERIGNIRADGRPILGLDSRDLLEILLEVDPHCHLIPAHIWTPWFALLGSKSGFDSVEECFGDLTPHIFALETGLSSDPPMNWRVSALDPYTLVSNSDAHSPQKLAREATLFDAELSYAAIFASLQSGDPANFLGTLEFFPEEGKYHLDGHRNCGIAWDPPTTRAHHSLCPVCGKEVTVGVMHRVEVLADRPEGQRPPRTHPFTSLVPLPEVLGELYSVGAGSQRVQHEYQRLLSQLGPELAILRSLPLEDIAASGGARLAEGIGRMRRGEVTTLGGYDGAYGVIRLLDTAFDQATSPQMSLFGVDDEQPATATPTTAARPREGEARRCPPALEPSLPAAGPSPAPTASVAPSSPEPKAPRPAPDPAELTSNPLSGLNVHQRAAVLHAASPLIVVAGPGTGKTRTLTVRIAHLVQAGGIPPAAILAITFTNKAAEEMAGRLGSLLSAELAGQLTIKTFHAFAALLLREHGPTQALPSGPTILDEDQRLSLLRAALPDVTRHQVAQLLARISTAKGYLLPPEAPALATDPQLVQAYRAYQAALQASAALDFDDLLMQAVHLLENRPEALSHVHQRYRWISVDEFQDINVAQYRLLQLLIAGGANLCVIGDPDQAIYGFRGADPGFFLTLQQDYPAAHVVRLGENYRSTQLILDAATQVIARQNSSMPLLTPTPGSTPPLQAVKALADFAAEVKLDVYRAPTDRAEAEYVVHRIEQMVGGTSYFSLDSGRVASTTPQETLSFADFAVLYRLSAQSRPLVEALERSGIPYQVARQTDDYDPRADRVALMTIHAAKGLEFPVVFIVGCEEGLLPYLRASRVPGMVSMGNSLHGPPDPFFMADSPSAAVDEERRLFYVGLTRAQRQLVLASARRRFLFGQAMENPPSRFVADIEAVLKEVHEMAQRPAAARPEGRQLSLF